MRDYSAKRELIQFVITNNTDCDFNIPLMQLNVYSINATTKYAWNVTTANISCGTGSIVINSITYQITYTPNLSGLLSALNALGFGFFCTETVAGQTYIYTVDDTNVYGNLVLCTTTTTTTTLSPGTTTTTTSTTSTTTTAAPTSTTTTSTTSTTTTEAPTTTTTSTTSTTTTEAPTTTTTSTTSTTTTEAPTTTTTSTTSTTTTEAPTTTTSTTSTTTTAAPTMYIYDAEERYCADCGFNAGPAIVFSYTPITLFDFAIATNSPTPVVLTYKIIGVSTGLPTQEVVPAGPSCAAACASLTSTTTTTTTITTSTTTTTTTAAPIATCLGYDVTDSLAACQDYINCIS